MDEWDYEEHDDRDTYPVGADNQSQPQTTEKENIPDERENEGELQCGKTRTIDHAGLKVNIPFQEYADIFNAKRMSFRRSTTRSRRIFSV